MNLFSASESEVDLNDMLYPTPCPTNTGPFTSNKPTSHIQTIPIARYMNREVPPGTLRRPWIVPHCHIIMMHNHTVTWTWVVDSLHRGTTNQTKTPARAQYEAHRPRPSVIQPVVVALSVYVMPGQHPIPSSE